MTIDNTDPSLDLAGLLSGLFGGEYVDYLRGDDPEATIPDHEAERAAAWEAAFEARCLAREIEEAKQLLERHGVQVGGGGKREDALTAKKLLDLLRRDYHLGRSTDGLLFAVPRYTGGLRVAREVRSIRSEVIRRTVEATGKVPSRDVLGQALDGAAAFAEQSDEQTVHLRSAHLSGRVVLDLGGQTGRVVEITADGWRVKAPDADTPLFRRSEATRPLPVPVRGEGDTSTALRDLLGLGADDPRWRLVRGWLALSLFGEAPRPVLWATGPMGSGKSTRARMVLAAIEPTDALGKEPGRNERDDSTAARARFVPSWDNITNVSQATSDWLCRLVTGVTDDRRALYTDEGLRPVFFRRTGVATSLSLPGRLGADALERLVVVPFDRVPDDARVGEVGLWERYDEQHAAILGAVLDDAVLVLRHLAEVTAEQRSWPRMADYAAGLLALDRGLGLAEDSGHLAAYVDTVNTRLAERAEDDPFTGAVIELLRSAGGEYRGTSEGLLRALAPHRPEDAPWWPSSVQRLTAELTKSTEALRHAGVTVEHRRTNKSRTVILVLAEPTEPATTTPY